ncbi:hypothetical protein FA95DRAFT_1557192 [Auriscalpium vulgare]|uniref:Uncharacterized protein n=1 Tax=Auriscalpium vulgare TaxID=40419 RepID=A0ACB8RYD5_9AGAM|nr:hypothetical protein FA95DRAFT_1557192 [Auriscalpium vulgare]
MRAQRAALARNRQAVLASARLPRLRAKHSEDERINERIEYLPLRPVRRAVVGQPRLPWIRLRPNMTSCSIPWHAHRRSYLTKKCSIVPGTEDCNTAFASSA